MTQMEEEKREHVLKMKKMEAEMEQVFEAKVKEKLQKLKDSEADVSCIFYSLSCLITFLILSSSDACSVEGKAGRGRLLLATASHSTDAIKTEGPAADVCNVM